MAAPSPSEAGPVSVAVGLSWPSTASTGAWEAVSAATAAAATAVVAAPLYSLLRKYAAMN